MIIMKKNISFFIPIIFVLFFSTVMIGCENKDSEKSKEDYPRTNIKIFKDTPAWDLAVAVEKQRVRDIKKIAKESPKLLNYQESKFGNTVLIWAVGMEKYKSVETLLKCGANPNIQSIRYKTYDEQTALSIASNFSWIDYMAKKDPKYVKLLLEYGANPNWAYLGAEHGTEPGTSILINSIGCGLEKTKALIKAGADINHKTKSGNTAAIEALMFGSMNADSEAREYAHYLIVEEKARVSEAYHSWIFLDEDGSSNELFPVDILRDWICDINSKDYKMKMEIVDEFAIQGVDYGDTKISESNLEIIKKRYPKNWKEYIEKY